MKEYLSTLIRNQNRLNNDELYVREILNKHLSNIKNKKLYKYRACSNRNFEILSQNEIWFSQASAFDDAFDCTLNIDFKQNGNKLKQWCRTDMLRFIYDLTESKIKQHGVQQPFGQDVFVECVNYCVTANGELDYDKYMECIEKYLPLESLDKFKEIFPIIKAQMKEQQCRLDELAKETEKVTQQQRIASRDRMWVYSMATDYNVATLWENYAGKYTGFCIEYSFGDFERYPFDDYKKLLYLFPIIYRSNKPAFDLVPGINNFLEGKIYGSENPVEEFEIQVYTNLQMYYKSRDYAFEQEWRLVLDGARGNRQKFPFVSAIYVGKDIKLGNYRRLKNIAKMLEIPIYKQIINKSNNGFQYVLEEGTK